MLSHIMFMEVCEGVDFMCEGLVHSKYVFVID